MSGPDRRDELGTSSYTSTSASSSNGVTHNLVWHAGAPFTATAADQQSVRIQEVGRDDRVCERDFLGGCGGRHGGGGGRQARVPGQGEMLFGTVDGRGVGGTENGGMDAVGGIEDGGMEDVGDGSGGPVGQGRWLRCGNRQFLASRDSSRTTTDFVQTN